MSDRTAFFGETLEAARYRFGDSSTDGGNYIVAEDLDGERVLLQFDYDEDEWQYAGDVDMGGGDLNSVGTARVDALEAESVSIGNSTATLTSEVDQTIPTDTATQVDFGGVESDDDGFDADETNDTITVESSGVYLIKHAVRWSSDAVWENGGRKRVVIRTGGSDIRTKDSQVFPVDDAHSDETSIITKLDAGEVVSGRVLQETGEDVQINAFGSSFRGRLSVVRLG